MRNPRKIICLDVETTGADPSTTEILQLSIIDYDGNVLFNHYIKPDRAKVWPGAERVNHISPLMVAREEHLDYYYDELAQIFDEAELVVAYNGDHYDIPIIARCGFLELLEKPSYDVMLEFAPIYGAWDDYHGSYTWQKLSVCADYYDYHGEGNFHDSLEDIRATLFCYKKMSSENDNEKILRGEAAPKIIPWEFDGADDDVEYDFHGLADKIHEVEEELAEKYCEVGSSIMDRETAMRAVSKPKISVFIYGFAVSCDILRERDEFDAANHKAIVAAFDEIPQATELDLEKYTEPNAAEAILHTSVMNFGNLAVFADFFGKAKEVVEEFFNDYI